MLSIQSVYSEPATHSLWEALFAVSNVSSYSPIESRIRADKAAALALAEILPAFSISQSKQSTVNFFYKTIALALGLDTTPDSACLLSWSPMTPCPVRPPQTTTMSDSLADHS